MLRWDGMGWDGDADGDEIVVLSVPGEIDLVALAHYCFAAFLVGVVNS